MSDVFSLDDDEAPVPVPAPLDETVQDTGLVLVSSDGKRFRISDGEQREWIQMCLTIKAALEGDAGCKEVPLPVKSAVLANVLQYVFLRRGVPLDPLPSPITSSDIHVECSDLACAQYISEIGKDVEALHALINASNMLACQSLLDLALTQQACLCQAVEGGIVAVRQLLRRRTLTTGKTTIAAPVR